MQVTVTSPKKVKPFLRWAGGKSKLLNRIAPYFPKAFNNYHEPFLGGGAVFFNLTTEHTCFLSDLNEDLINTYVQVRDHVDLVIRELKSYNNSERFYYTVRESHENDLIKKAAQFIFLNKTSFNGIYRVNLEGQYNVPYGFRKNVDIIDETNLNAASQKLKNVRLLSQDFGKALARVRERDLVFLDPPYTVAHENNGFISYNQKIFSLNGQVRLAEWIQKIEQKGAYYILTNAKHDAIREIYANLNSPISIHRTSTIGGVGSIRGKVGEFIFTNCANLQA
jgi:DNA adenine methylase